MRAQLNRVNRTRLGHFVAALAALAALLIGTRAHAQFVDVTKSSGLQALRDAKPADLWLSGTHLLDLDGDGDLDFFFGSHGGFHGLPALNDGHGKFSPSTLAKAASTEIHLVHDLNEDGLPDASFTEDDGVTRWFQNASKAGAPAFMSTSNVKAYSRNGSVGDIDGDGNVDWICGGGYGYGMPEAAWLYFGDGKGGFRKEVQALEIPGNDRDTAWPIAADLDADGDLDLIIVWQGAGADTASRPRVYRNDGPAAGKVTLTLATEAMGFSETPGLWILGVGDLDQDGDTDVIARDKALFAYVNDGRGHFTKKAGIVTGEGLKGNDLALAATTDLDNDGVVDLVVGGFSSLWLLRGQGAGSFTVMNGPWGVTGTDGNGSRVSFAFGDIDGDGDLDLVGPRTWPPKMQFNVYRNDLPAKNWLNVRPVGNAGHRGAMGALISVYEAGTDHLLWFEEVAHYSYQIMQNQYAHAESERHFGLGARTSVDVSVLFRPSNKLVTKKGVPANSTVRLTEDGAGTVVTPDKPAPTDAGTAPSSDAGPKDAGTSPPEAGAAGTSGAGGTSGAAGTNAGGAGTTGAAGATSGGAAGTSPEPRETSGGGCSLAGAIDRTALSTLLALLALGARARRRSRL
jgi:hypothetical protein